MEALIGGAASLYWHDGNLSRLGIGTSNPSDILHIQGNASTTRLQIENTAANGDPILMLQTDGATNWYIGIDDSDADKLMFMSDGGAWDPAAAAVTFTTDGKVGIGTNSPSNLFTIESTSAFMAVARNTSNDVAGAVITVDNSRGGNNGVAEDYCGAIRFNANDSRRNFYSVCQNFWDGSFSH